VVMVTLPIIVAVSCKFQHGDFLNTPLNGYADVLYQRLVDGKPRRMLPGPHHGPSISVLDRETGEIRTVMDGSKTS
jgi:hypothetical protein